jgi:flagellin
MIQTAEGVMDTMHSIVHRMRNLAVQSANDNYTTYDRQRLQKEVDELIDEVDRIGNYTEFNTKKLLDGSTVGRANSLDKKVLNADVVGQVVNADYSVTVVRAGEASNVHGSVAFQDNNGDGLADLRDLGMSGDVELQVTLDGFTRAVGFNEEDNINDIVRKINSADLGIQAGVHSYDGKDYLTMTSRHSGSRFNISFGQDPDGVAIALGLTGGNRNSVDSTSLAISGDANAEWLKFTSGTNTIISVVNITDQRLFPTIPPGIADETQITTSQRILGRFVSDSDIFTEKELSTAYTAANNDLSFTIDNTRTSQLRDSGLLRGVVLRVDEDIDFGTADIATYDTWGTSSVTNYHFATIPQGVDGGLKRGSNEFTIGQLTNNTTQEAASLLSVRLSVRDARQVFHIGANEGQTLTVDFGNLTSEALGLKVGLYGAGNTFDGNDRLDNGSVSQKLQLNVSIETQQSAESAITVFNDALNIVSEARAKLGAYQNSLEKSVDYLNIAYENQVASESRIRDVDMAKEMTEFTRNQILTQSGTAMLAQANVKPQTILSLL